MFFFVCLLYACYNDSLPAEDNRITKTFITHDTIPEIRNSINKQPIASYISSKGDKLKVDVYEIKQMFRFIMHMKYKFLDELDTLRIPNFGIRPVIVIRGGDNGQSCTIGFLDTKGNFKEYKRVTVKSGNLQVKVLKRYYTGHHKTVYDDTSAVQQ